MAVKLTTQIRKLAAQIVLISDVVEIDILASDIGTKANLIDARDERKKPTARRKPAKRKPVKRKAPARRRTARKRVAVSPRARHTDTPNG